MWQNIWEAQKDDENEPREQAEILPCYLWHGGSVDELAAKLYLQVSLLQKN